MSLPDQETAAGDADSAAAEPQTSNATPLPPTATSSTVISTSTAASASRPHYVPQFSAATQMILQRIGKPGSLSSALSSASALSRDIEPSAFQDAKRRLVMNMNTSLTMPLPPPPTGQIDTAASLAMNDAFQLRTPSLGKSPAIKTASAKTLALPKSTPGPSKTTRAAQASPSTTPRSSQKRKRVKTEDSAESPSSTSLSQHGTPASGSKLKTTIQPPLPPPPPPTPATTTKSGRQVLKPTTYNPNTVEAAQVAGTQQISARRKHWGKRTAEQALCKVCTRGLSPLKNQVVFCDGCNFCWHQLCHEPYIDDEFVSDESRSWFCSKCLAKRERHLARKKTVDGFRGVSWAAKSADQRRTYLSSLPAAQLANLVMYSLELHPDLPIFPQNDNGKRGAATIIPSANAQSPTQTTNGRNTPSDMTSHAPTQYSRKFSTPLAGKSNGKPSHVITEDQQAARESSTDSVPPSWPKSGQGCLSNMELLEDDFHGKNDFEAFSLTTYDGRGRKLVENGLPAVQSGGGRVLPPR